MYLSIIKIFVLLHIGSVGIAGDYQEHLGDVSPYANSNRGYFHGVVAFDDECLGRKIEIMKSIRIKVLEVDTLGRPRQMGSGILKKKYLIPQRIPYTDYVVQMYHVRERFVIKEYKAPAYNSPESFNFEVDCNKIMAHIYEQKKLARQAKEFAIEKARLEKEAYKEKKRLREVREVQNRKKREMVEKQKADADAKNATSE